MICINFFKMIILMRQHLFFMGEKLLGKVCKKIYFVGACAPHYLHCESATNNQCSRLKFKIINKVHLINV